LYATNEFEFDDIFERVNLRITESNTFFGNLEYVYFYHQAHGLYNRGLYRNNEAMMHLSRSYDIALQLQNDSYIARSLALISTIFDMNQDRDSALSYSRRSVELCSKIDDQWDIADIYMNYALLIDHSGNHKEALSGFHYAEKTYEFLPECDSYLNYCVTLFNIAKAYIALDDEVKAKYYFDKSMAIGKKQGFLGYFTRSIRFIAEFYRHQDDIEKAYDLLLIYLTFQQKSINNRIKAIANKHQIEYLPHFESMHQLYQMNSQLHRELNALQQTIFSKKNFSESEEKKFVEIIQGIQNDEFAPYLQPTWCINTQKMLGAELLARWHKPDGRIISPYDFIESIENTEFMALLSEKLFKETLNHIAPFIKTEMPEFKLSINVSPYQLAHQNLVAFLELCCVEYGIKPKNISVEIIERIFIENNPEAISQIFELSTKGFSIALDDFGSGYSSLSCLVSLPVDTVKIDRSLISGIKSGERSERLFRSIIAMVTELDMDTIAEGIETEEQWLIVKETGCKEGQGFMIAKPCSIKDCHWLYKTEF
jgi:EAL domain-containing protein (putative c-di-GMP-specific phosphodiesterase class I)